MAKRKQPTFIKGTTNHRRTESNYMSVLLDSVTLDDWQEVVSTALQAAKAGDPQARTWLAQCLVGKPEAKAPTPLTVVVQQLDGTDPVAESLAAPTIEKGLFPMLHGDDDWVEGIRALAATELAETGIDT